MRAMVSSATLPAGDRFEWFSALVDDALMPTSISCTSPGAFHAEASLLDLGATRVSTFRYAPLRSRRTAAHIRRGDPEQYQLALVTGGTMWINQRRNESGPICGDLVLWDTSQPFEAGAPDEGPPVRAVVIQLPKEDMPFHGRKLDRLLARPLSGSQGAGAILARCIASLVTHGAECEAAAAERVGAAVMDLASACLAQYLDAYEELPREAQERVLLEKVSSFIDLNLGDPRLSPAAVAAHHHVSLRRLHQLFARREEEGVAASIRRCRLERCRADLCSPLLRDRPIAAIAARWGFSGPGVFSRAFREAYGISPSEARRAAAQTECAQGEGILRAM
ncbi:helix-turn-helix domain-containing protein [Streptomyces sp. NPDC006879]|uniref:AraC-like ligand-binding domain-containing protein n=1 Tax=Streptomyces sp. NPDC006879 TaxID=3364767 RepID=UPI0036791311